MTLYNPKTHTAALIHFAARQLQPGKWFPFSFYQQRLNAELKFRRTTNNDVFYILVHHTSLYKLTQFTVSVWPDTALLPLLRPAVDTTAPAATPGTKPQAGEYPWPAVRREMRKGSWPLPGTCAQAEGHTGPPLRPCLKPGAERLGRPAPGRGQAPSSPPPSPSLRPPQRAAGSAHRARRRAGAGEGAMGAPGRTITLVSIFLSWLSETAMAAGPSSAPGAAAATHRSGPAQPSRPYIKKTGSDLPSPLPAATPTSGRPWRHFLGRRARGDDSSASERQRPVLELPPPTGLLQAPRSDSALGIRNYFAECLKNPNLLRSAVYCWKGISGN